MPKGEGKGPHTKQLGTALSQLKISYHICWLPTNFVYAKAQLKSLGFILRNHSRHLSALVLGVCMYTYARSRCLYPSMFAQSLHKSQSLK